MKKDLQKKTSQGELDTILRFGSLINSSLNIEDVLNHAMKWAEEFMDAEASSVYELNRERNEIFIRLARGEKREPIRGIRLKVGEGIAGWVVKTGRPVVSQDVSKDKRFSDKYDKKTGFKTSSMICVPLIAKDEPIGALQVINKKSKKPFTQADFKLLTGMAQQIAVAME
ncbi:MAG: GAF domain-containing protein, partial [Desulfobacterales bacterium]|nr:GAF domain-containing protein [Desulfobacterales bacterium]